MVIHGLKRGFRIAKRESRFDRDTGIVPTNVQWHRLPIRALYVFADRRQWDEYKKVQQMFSKTKINEPGPRTTGGVGADAKTSPAPVPKTSGVRPEPPKSKPPATLMSQDIHIIGNIQTTGDIQVEGKVDGDIRAHLLTIGESSVIKGEVVADDIVVNGRIVGRVRGLKVRLSSTARVEGDIVNKSIAIESGAHFEGTVHHQEDPLNSRNAAPKATGRTAPPDRAAS